MGVGAYAAVRRLGRTYGSTRDERRAPMPGDAVVSNPAFVADHAVTVDASPDEVWPWLAQVGWHRGGWYTARWVDRLLFPANNPSVYDVIPELQGLRVGDSFRTARRRPSAGLPSNGWNITAACCCIRTRTCPSAGGPKDGRASTGPGASCSSRWTMVGGRDSSSGGGPRWRRGWTWCVVNSF